MHQLPLQLGQLHGLQEGEVGDLGGEERRERKGGREEGGEREGGEGRMGRLGMVPGSRALMRNRRLEEALDQDLKT